MELEQLIKDLNNKAVQTGYPDIWTYPDLSDTEKALLDKYRPENAFIVYGTLGPEGPNHHVVKEIRGEWHTGIVRGKLEKDGWGAAIGYYGFRHTEKAEQQDIKATILISEDMQDNWQRLDEFEGDGYVRILASYELHDGKVGVGYIYGLR